MRLFLDSGTAAGWTEPDGTIVNIATIAVWCALSVEQLWSQSEFNFAFCEVSWYTYKYPLYASQEEVDEYKKIYGFTTREDSIDDDREMSVCSGESSENITETEQE